MAEPKSVRPAVNTAMRRKCLSYQEPADKLGQSSTVRLNLRHQTSAASITVFIAVVTGNSPVPGPTPQNVAEALEMKIPIPLDGTYGVPQYSCTVIVTTLADNYNIAIRHLQAVTFILPSTNARDPEEALIKATNAAGLSP